MENIIPEQTTQERAQRIALAIHAISDRFSAHEEAFGRRLKESALELIEDVVLYEIAKTRDAAGTARLIHKLIERTESLRQLLSFIKHRGLVRSGVIENLDWELGELMQVFQLEDARFEEHVSRKHPMGAIIESHPEPVSPMISEAPVLPVQPVETPTPAPHAGEPQPIAVFDPLLGPDETTANAAISKKNTAIAVVQEAETASIVVAATMPAPIAAIPADLPTVEKSPIEKEKAVQRVPSGLTDRQRKILGLFDREKEAPLKRVMELLPMFSEKTLRNDLKALVQLQKVERIGKAPRSKYVLTA